MAEPLLREGLDESQTKKQTEGDSSLAVDAWISPAPATCFRLAESKTAATNPFICCSNSQASIGATNPSGRC